MPLVFANQRQTITTIGPAATAYIDSMPLLNAGFDTGDGAPWGIYLASNPAPAYSILTSGGQGGSVYSLGLSCDALQTPTQYLRLYQTMDTRAGTLYSISYFYQVITSTQNASSPQLYFGAYDGTGANPGIDLMTPVKWSLWGSKKSRTDIGIDGNGNTNDQGWYSLNSTTIPYTASSAPVIQFMAIGSQTTLQVQYKCNSGGQGEVYLDTFMVEAVPPDN
jgi:hypothetical protein